MSEKVRRCSATNKKGGPCKAAVTETGFCYLHSEAGRAAQIGREGGRRNRHYVDTTLTPLPPLNSNANLCEAVATLIHDAYAGKTNARRIAPLVPLFSTLQRLQRSALIEERIKRIEEQIKKSSAGKVASEEEDPDS